MSWGKFLSDTFGDIRNGALAGTAAGGVAGLVTTGGIADIATIPVGFFTGAATGLGYGLIVHGDEVEQKTNNSQQLPIGSQPTPSLANILNNNSNHNNGIPVATGGQVMSDPKKIINDIKNKEKINSTPITVSELTYGSSGGKGITQEAINHLGDDNKRDFVHGGNWDFNKAMSQCGKNYQHIDATDDNDHQRLKSLSGNNYYTNSFLLLEQQIINCKNSFEEQAEKWRINKSGKRINKGSCDYNKGASDFLSIFTEQIKSLSLLKTSDSVFNKKFSKSYEDSINALTDRLSVVQNFTAAKSFNEEIKTLDENVATYFSEAFHWDTLLVDTIAPAPNRVMPWLGKWESMTWKDVNKDTGLIQTWGNGKKAEYTIGEFIGNGETCRVLDVIHITNSDMKGDTRLFEITNYPANLVKTSKVHTKDVTSGENDDSLLCLDSVYSLGAIPCTSQKWEGIPDPGNRQYLIPIVKTCLYIVYNGLYCNRYDGDPDGHDKVSILSNNRTEVQNYIHPAYPRDPWEDIFRQLETFKDMITKITAAIPTDDYSSVQGLRSFGAGTQYTTSTPKKKTDTPPPVTGGGGSGGNVPHPRKDSLTEDDIKKLIHSETNKNPSSTGGANQIPNQMPQMPSMSPSGLSPSLSVPGGGGHNPVAPTSAHEHDPDHHHHTHHHKETTEHKGKDYDILSNPTGGHPTDTSHVDTTTKHVADPTVKPHDKDNFDDVITIDSDHTEDSAAKNLTGAKDTIMIHGMKCHFDDTALGGHQGGEKAALLASHFGEDLGNGLHATMKDAAEKAGLVYDSAPGHLPGEKVNTMASVVPGNILHTSAQDYMVVAKDGHVMKLLDSTGNITDLSKIPLNPKDSDFAFCKLADNGSPYPDGAVFGKNMDSNLDPIKSSNPNPLNPMNLLHPDNGPTPPSPEHHAVPAAATPTAHHAPAPKVAPVASDPASDPNNSSWGSAQTPPKPPTTLQDNNTPRPRASVGNVMTPPRVKK